MMPVTKSSSSPWAACSNSDAFVKPTCSSSGALSLRAFRRLPTHKVAARAAATPCPMASVRDRWRTSRARLKSNVSPAMPAAGSNQPARVNDPASHVCGPGSRRCWISADRLKGRVRLSPLEQIGVPPIRDHDERQQVCQLRDLTEGGGVRLVGQGQLQEADDLPALRHRSQHEPRVGRRTPSTRFDDLHLLGAYGELGRAAVERHHRGGLLDSASLAPRDRSVDGDSGGGAEPDVRETDQGPPGQVRDEKGDLGRPERQAELTGDRLDGIDRRSRFGGRQDAAQRSCHFVCLHQRSIGAWFRSAGATQPTSDAEHERASRLGW